MFHTKIYLGVIGIHLTNRKRIPTGLKHSKYFYVTSEFHITKYYFNITEQIWEQDLGDTFKIDASTQGLQMVHLKCGSNSMHVELETEENFHGVMYTRGSFYKQTEPCFVKAKAGKSSRSLLMKFTLDECQTMQDGDLYKNVVVVQHDPELVTPGTTLLFS